MTKEQRAELLRLCEAATHGPWVVRVHNGDRLVWSNGINARVANVPYKPDAEFMLAARTAVESLLRDLEAAEVQAERFHAAAADAVSEQIRITTMLTAKRDAAIQRAEAAEAEAERLRGHYLTVASERDVLRGELTRATERAEELQRIARDTGTALRMAEAAERELNAMSDEYTQAVLQHGLRRDELAAVKRELDALRRALIAEHDKEKAPTIEELIDRSSFGTPEAKAIRAEADPQLVDEVMRRVAEHDGESGKA